MTYVFTYVTYYLLFNSCFIQTATAYSSTINTICGGNTTAAPGDTCDIAGEAVDEACFVLLELEDNATCTGTCGSQLATAAAVCTTTVSLSILLDTVASY